MTTQEKLTKLNQYLQEGAAFDEFLTAPAALLDFRPGEDAWTIREHLLHFVDADLNAVVRYRKAVAEPGQPIAYYEEELWTKNLGYATQDLAVSLALLKNLRQLTFDHLKSIADQDWTQFAYLHPANGLVNLESWLDTYLGHYQFHKRYIERNQKLFKEQY